MTTSTFSEKPKFIEDSAFDLGEAVSFVEQPILEKKNISGAEAVILSLIAEQVEAVFGYPGGAIMPVYDALHGYNDKLKHYLVRHEQGATHAAQGYARVAKRAGVCFATSGPGATNLITGIADAMIDSTPLVCITGQVARHLLGTDAFQETDVIGISMPVTKWNFQVTRADEIAEAIAKAFYIAESGRPGPVLIDITKNAQIEMCDFVYRKCTRVRSYVPQLPIKMKAINEAAELINHAQKPMFLIGQGIILSQAQEELKKVLEKSGAPAASTLLGLSALSHTHPNYVGYLGMHGNYGPNVKSNEADVIIAVGMRFDDRVTGDLKTYLKKAKIIHIEIDPAEIDKNVKTDVAIISDAKEALIALLPKLKQKTYPEWMAEFKECDRIEKEKVLDKDFAPNTEKIKMAEVIKMLSEKTKGKAIIVTDVGQHQMTTTRYYQFEQTQSNITSGGLGTMGFALPASIGAKIGRQDREVIAIIGDGGFQMTLQELGVIMQYEVGVKIVILNNSFLGMVRQWQQLFFEKRYSFTEMHNPNFVKLAEAYNIPAKKLEKREDMSNVLDLMLDHKGSFLLEIVVEKEDNVFPMVPAGASVSNIRLE
ncbi:MAG: biosynthetic-type acetolactate synthase large subunit [Bacteroidetes bacterium]|nr:MAG: biosynthetic-type acetolactate synthase large subunit [Bacteroidota bacterium]